jgi:thioredoxin 1
MKKVTRFTAEWCSPCKALAPLLEEVQQESDGVEFHTIDIDKQPELATSKGIRSIPTVIVEVDGIEMHRLIGLHPKERYVESINN